MPSALLDRLNEVQDLASAAEVMAERATWRGAFGAEMDRVNSIMVHLTAGHPTRDKVDVFVSRMVWPASTGACRAGSRCGVFTQYYISYDGTVVQMIEMDPPRRTAHATWVNNWAIGVETGNLSNDAAPPGNRWTAASGNADDIPGARLWFRSGGYRELLAGWWTTTSFNGPSRGPVPPNIMLFSEAQYRGWSLLLRYLTEKHGLPRNFPLLPWKQRMQLNRDANTFRRLVLADERAEVMLREFERPAFGIPRTSFDPGNEALLQTQYAALEQADNGSDYQRNPAHTFFIGGTYTRTRRVPGFRGVHGHHFSGAINRGPGPRDFDPKTECPGPVFDMFRLARESWDWWWYPFDVEDDTSAVPIRAYRNWGRDTPLVEYYWDESFEARSVREVEGIHGPTSSPATFRLEPGSPVYAMANGEVVAARFPAPGDGVSMAFVLVRHEVFHRSRQDLSTEVASRLGFPSPHAGQIDFDQPPSYVYSLTMHLGRPEGMDLDAVHATNPDWLNRVLIREKECELGLNYIDHTNHTVPERFLNNRPAGAPERPTLVEGWRADRTALQQFLNHLRSGATAVPPRGPRTRPIRVILGDFLGDSGVIRTEGGEATHGIRVEVFAPAFSPPPFLSSEGEGWTQPPGSTAPVAVRYPSEWSRLLGPDDLPAFDALGVDPGLLHFWHPFALGTLTEHTPIPGAVIRHGEAQYHLHPLAFARWINEVTWAHEWPKYQVTDSNGAAVPVRNAAGELRRPRSRRI